ncbi:unnamed protein product [Aphanomyces euteiches]
METEVGKWLQRDVNCLSDPQRMVRKRSLEKLSQVSDLAAKFGQDQLVLFFQAQLFKPLVQCIADPVEKCRELSLRTCKEFAKLGAVHGETMVNDLIHMMHTRVGKTPFVEAAEEIRLLILELLHAVIQTTPPEQLLPAEIMDILGKAATDPFPDAKRACCDATLAVAQKWKPLIKQHLGTVVKPHAMNLGHQHAKIRQCSLQALEAVVPCGSSSLPELMKDILLPNFIKVMFDRSPVVRKQLVQTTASWFEHIDELREFEAPLLPLFLAGLADESPDVQNHSLQWLDMLSKKWAVDYASEDHDMEEHDNFIESPPFKSRPPKGARLNAQRQKSASILRILLILAEDAVNSHVDKILTALAKSCRDDETEVVESVRSCMNVVGRYSQTDLFFSLLLPLAAGRLAGQDTPHHRTNGLVLLSMGISGMEANRILPHMEAITETLSESGLRDTEVPEMQLNLAHLTASIVATGAPLFATHDTLAFRLFWVLSHLVASTAEDSVAHATALETLGELAKACHVDEEACGDQVHLIVPIILAHLDPSKEPDVRLAFLALLETMLGNELIAQSFQPFASSMLVKGITPNIVWQSGKVAATVRKVAMASTYTLLRQGLANQPALFESAPQMLPVLKSCLDDTDAKTRQLVCLSLQHLFVALPNALGEEPVSQLYHDILKRLDDSNDLVRKAACATYITFLRAAPRSHFRGTIIDYTMDALFVHLDDPDPEIQAAVFDVLRETFSVDPELLGKKAREHRTRHRSPYYCDQLIAL